jgi:hypothetical protein
MLDLIIHLYNLQGNSNNMSGGPVQIFADSKLGKGFKIAVLERCTQVPRSCSRRGKITP